MQLYFNLCVLFPSLTFYHLLFCPQHHVANAANTMKGYININSSPIQIEITLKSLLVRILRPLKLGALQLSVNLFFFFFLKHAQILKWIM